jgi:hypothetical protein
MCVVANENNGIVGGSCWYITVNVCWIQLLYSAEFIAQPKSSSGIPLRISGLGWSGRSSGSRSVSCQYRSMMEWKRGWMGDSPLVAFAVSRCLSLKNGLPSWSPVAARSGNFLPSVPHRICSPCRICTYKLIVTLSSPLCNRRYPSYTRILMGGGVHPILQLCPVENTTPVTISLPS